MAYVRRATTLFLLVLFLQAFAMCKSKPDKPVYAVKEPYKELQSGDQGDQKEQKEQKEQEDYDSGYGSDSEPNKEWSMLSDDKEDHVYFDFEEQIYALRRAADAKRGVRWNWSGDSLTREVVDSGNNLYAAEDYAVQIVNIYRAAKKMCALYGKDGSLFTRMANDFMQHYAHHATATEDFWTKEVKNINHTVVLKLHQMVFPNENPLSVNKKLRLAENYVGLDDTHYNVTTTFKVEDKKFALEDKKWLKLTEKQKSEFINRKSKAWYIRLDPFEQKLVDAYFDKILDGKHYIPTQIRKIPGCRNAYIKRVLAYDENNNPIELGCYCHSGSLASPIEWEDKATDKQITNDNWEQINNQYKNIKVLSLNYNMNMPYLDNLREKKIVEDTMEVVGEDRFMNLSINRIGTMPMFRPQVHKLIEESTDFYQKRYPRLCKAFKKGTKLDRNKLIEQIKDPRDKGYFNRLEQLKEATEKSDLKNSLIQNAIQIDNYYANIASNYITCMSKLRKAAPPFVLFSCKSGKDRTGLMSLMVDANIFRMNYPSLDIDKGRKIYKALAYAAHPQFLASVNGGMPGRFGMKPVRGNEIIDDFTEQLFPKAAQLTAIGLN